VQGLYSDPIESENGFTDEVVLLDKEIHVLLVFGHQSITVHLWRIVEVIQLVPSKVMGNLDFVFTVHTLFANQFPQLGDLQVFLSGLAFQQILRMVLRQVDSLTFEGSFLYLVGLVFELGGISLKSNLQLTDFFVLRDKFSFLELYLFEGTFLICVDLSKPFFILTSHLELFLSCPE